MKIADLYHEYKLALEMNEIATIALEHLLNRAQSKKISEHPEFISKKNELSENCKAAQLEISKAKQNIANFMKEGEVDVSAVYMPKIHDPYYITSDFIDHIECKKALHSNQDEL